MKRVAIVSCYFQKNYGSMLQAFATQKALGDLGYENETICIDGIAKEIRNAKLKHYFSQIRHVEVIKGKWGFVKRFVRRKTNNRFNKNIQMREKKFIDFREKYFRVSEQCGSKEELGVFCENFSSVLVGSDQLWLPSNIDADYYTLSFVSEQINKVAYATSFGVAEMPRKQQPAANRFLNRINHISVRENSGKKIVEDIVHRDIPVVCDPTLLLTHEEWLEAIPHKMVLNEKYIFCYFLGNNPDQRQFVKRIKEKTGLKVVSLLHMDEYIKSDEGFPDYAPYDIGPEEFVNLIRNAQFVFTDSFHGTVFSVLHQKSFYTFKRFEDQSTLSTNTRMNSLFDLLGLQDRFIMSTTLLKTDCIKKEIDYHNVLKRVEIFRQESIGFLIDALEDGK